MYLYRCTTDKLLDHIASIEGNGDAVRWPVFVGGRDWILVCARGSQSRIANYRAALAALVDDETTANQLVTQFRQALDNLVDPAGCGEVSD